MIEDIKIHPDLVFEYKLSKVASKEKPNPRKKQKDDDYDYFIAQDPTKDDALAAYYASIDDMARYALFSEDS